LLNAASLIPKHLPIHVLERMQPHPIIFAIPVTQRRSQLLLLALVFHTGEVAAPFLAVLLCTIPGISLCRDFELKVAT